MSLFSPWALLKISPFFFCLACTALVDQLSLYRRVGVVPYPAHRPLGYEDLTTFVKKRAPKEPFVVLGESFSGPIAIEVAAAEPRVTGLILASSFARHPMPSLLAPLARTLNLKRVPRRIVEFVLLGSTATTEIAGRLDQVLNLLPREIIQTRASDALRVDKRNRLREITCPVLCLHGRFDRLVRRRAVDEIISEQPRCQVHWFDASHMLLETHAKEAAEVINRFCNQLS